MTSQVNFLKKNMRFILPAPLLFVAILKFWQAISDNNELCYIESAAFATASFLFYWAQLKIHIEQSKMDAEAGTAD